MESVPSFPGGPTHTRGSPGETPRLRHTAIQTRGKPQIVTLAQGSTLAFCSLTQTGVAQPEHGEYPWHSGDTKRRPHQTEGFAGWGIMARATVIAHLVDMIDAHTETQSLTGSRKRQSDCRYNDRQTGSSGRSHSRCLNCPANPWRNQVVGSLDLVSMCLGVVPRAGGAHCCESCSKRGSR